MAQPNTMTDAELLSSIRYLNGQIACGGIPTPLTDPDPALLRERNDYDRELRRRRFGRARLYAQD